MITDSLYKAPKGMVDNIDSEGIDIEIIDPENEESPEDIPVAGKFEDNLAEDISDNDLETLASELLEDYENDLNSRKDWETTYAEGIKLLGLKYEERTEPWDGACGTFSPLLTEAVVRFQSEAITEQFPAAGPVKTNIIGKKTKEKEEAAVRVMDDMNYQLTEVMTEFRPEHEKMLWNLPISGSAMKKVYYDPSKLRQVSMFVPAEDVIIPYGTSELSAAPRVTHRMRKTNNDILKLQKAKFYVDIEIGDPSKDITDIQRKKDEETGFSASYDDRFTLLEMHVEIDLKGYEDKDSDGEPTGIAYPYVVTILKDNGKILSIRRNWLEQDVTKQKRNHFVHYQYIPGFGAYGFGLLHLIGGATKSATSLIRQLVDAGTLANLPGGLKARGLRIKGDDTPIAPGEFRDVDVASGTVRDNIMPLPYKEPSQTLLALLNQIVDEARRFAATADMKVSDMSGQAPVGTTLALLERQLKIMSAVQARLHYSMKQELRLLGTIIRDYTDEDYDYDADSDDGPKAKKADYAYTEIIPVSDPNAATMSQRIVQYQAALQLSQTAPQIYNLPYLHRQMLETLGIKNVDKVVALPEDQAPQDPVTENMDVLRGNPVKVFAYQDHEAHTATHQAFMQDPKIAATMGQNPAAQQMMGALMAHIAEHAAFSYRAQIEQALGVPLPPLDEDDRSPISKDDEKNLAPLIAQAAQQTLVQNQAAAQQAQNQQMNQDPTIQLQQAELKLKELESQRKAQNDKYDFQIGQERLKVERERMAFTAKKDQAKLMLDSQNKNADRNVKAKIEGMKIVSAHSIARNNSNKEKK